MFYAYIEPSLTLYKLSFRAKEKTSFFSNFLKFVITPFLLSFESSPLNFMFYAYNEASLILYKLSFRGKEKTSFF